MNIIDWTEVVGASVLFLCLCVLLRSNSRAKKRAIEAEAARLDAVRVALEAGERASLQQRRADEFFGIIRGIETERDIWQRMYYESARQSGAAQSWLTRDLAGALQRANAFAAELRKLGKPAKDVRIDPALTDVLAEYSTTHPKSGDAVPPAPGFERAEAVERELTAGAPTTPPQAD